MTDFKRFNTSNYSNGPLETNVLPNGTLTWNSDQGLRLHDGSTSGGNPAIVSGNKNPMAFNIPNPDNTVSWANITNKPSCFPPCVHNINKVTGDSTGYAYWDNTTGTWKIGRAHV